MRKSFKKALALVLTAALAFSTPIATNATKAAAAEDATEYTNPSMPDEITGTDWWSGPNENSSTYYVASGSSVDIYVTNTAGGQGVVLEAHDSATPDANYFDWNMQGTDSWGSLITDRVDNSTASAFPAGGTVKLNITRDGNQVNVVSTNMEDDSTVADITFTVGCPDDEVLGFYVMATDGSFKVAPYCNPLKAEDIEGTAWWGPDNTGTSNYYLASGSSVDMYIAKTGNGAGVILETSASTGWFTMNLEGINDGDFWGDLINAETKPANNNIGFANVSTAKITLTRENGQMNVLITNLADESLVADLTIDLTCPDEEVLGFYLKGQFGTFTVGPTLASIANFIKGANAIVSGGAIEVSAEVVDTYDSIAVSVNDEVVEDAEIVESENAVTYTYAPTESGTYNFAFIASKAGYPDDVEEASIKVEVAEDGTVTADVEMIADLKATKAAGAYSITFKKLIEDATYTVAVTEGTKNITVEADNTVKFDNLTNGKEYTVTVTATKDSYVTKTASTTFTYVEEKIEDAGANVKRTMINKTIGETDCSTAWFPEDDKYFEAFKIEDKMKYTFVFENHSPGTQNYQNFMLMFTNEAENYTEKTRPASWVEYAVVRSDNWGWGGGDNRTLSGKEITYDNSIISAGGSWDDWKAIMKDANITMDVVRSGAEIQIVAEIVSQADATKKMTYKVNLNAANADGTAPNPLYMAFTVDSAYLNLKYVDEQASDVKLDASKDVEVPKRAKQMMIKSITAKAGAKKVTGEVNASNATVEIKVGKNAWKKATVSGKKFTLKTAKLKIGTKIKVKAYAEGYTTAETSKTVKGTMKLSAIKAKKGSKKITAKVSVKKATVKVKVGKAKYKKAKVKGKKITFTVKKALKKGTKVKFKVTKKNYKTLTKTVKVKK